MNRRSLWGAIGRTFRRVLTLVVAVYVLLAIVAIVSFPKSSWRAIKAFQVEILLAPLYAPSVIHTHLRLAGADPRLSPATPDVVSVADLLQAHGEFDGHVAAVVLDTSPPDLRDRRTAAGAPEGSSTLVLSEEHYSRWLVGAALGHESAGVLSIGEKTCLMKPAYKLLDLFAPASCFQIRKLGTGDYRFEGVDGERSFPAVYDAELQRAGH